MATPYKDSPIVFLSVFKSGTVLMRQIIEDITSLTWIEPEIIPGKVNYQDPDQLFHKDGYFYSWHLFPNKIVRNRLKYMDAKPIIIMRNICDLIVSMYYHFANNTDADIGRGRNVDHYFRQMSQEEGLISIIKGMYRPDFKWTGIGPHLQQMRQMLVLTKEIPSFLTTYERMTINKEAEIQRLADYLKISITPERRYKIAIESDFKRMKNKAIAANRGSHFRRGKTGDYKNILTERHISLIMEELENYTPTLNELVEEAGVAEVISGAGQNKR